MSDEKWLRAAACALSTIVLVACHSGTQDRRGAQLVRAYGCDGCHAIPGMSRAQAKIGPPLYDLKERVYIAGVIPNTPQNLTRWIEHPRRIDSRTAMPELGVTEQDARDIAAYLYSR